MWSGIPISLRIFQFIVIHWNVAPLSMGFSREEYWNILLFPSPGDLPNPGINPRSPALHVDSLTSEPPFFFFLNRTRKESFLSRLVIN